MDSWERGVRQALWITVGGVIASGLVGVACYLALPGQVQSTMAGAPRGQLQAKGEALAFLLWLIPALAVFIVGIVAGCTALGPDVLNLRRPQAKEFWSRPENWPAARGFILRTVAVLTGGICVLVVAVTCLDAGEQAWHLPGAWWAVPAAVFVGLLVWLVRQTLRLEHPETLRG